LGAETHGGFRRWERNRDGNCSFITPSLLEGNSGSTTDSKQASKRQHQQPSAMPKQQEIRGSLTFAYMWWALSFASRLSAADGAAVRQGLSKAQGRSIL